MKKKEEKKPQEAGAEPDPSGTGEGGSEAGHETLEGAAVPDAPAGSDGDGPGPGEQAEAEPEAGEPQEPEEVRLAREVEHWNDKYLRLLADFENYKKRASKEKSDLIQYGNESLLKDLLPVIDNMERVLAYSMQEGDWKDFQRGVELVVSEIHKTLARHGVEPLQVLGKEFDPNHHEAMQRVETDQAAPDTVVEEFQKGYLFRDRLLRPSLVAVAAAAAESEAVAGGSPDPDPGPEGEEEGSQGD